MREAPLNVLFLHHSVGEHLLADEGADDGTGLVHPNGGGLRATLVRHDYRVHHATYGSALGERTDLLDWLPKFRDAMPRILRTAKQDLELPSPQVNHVVVFKSCFTNNDFVSEGTEPGDPRGAMLTLTNAKSSFRALLPIFWRQPETLFVFLTTPPLLARLAHESVYRRLAKKLVGRPTLAESLARRGRISRAFADWAVSPDGWLAHYPRPNVRAFPYHAVLGSEGTSGFLAYPSGGGADNHPSAAGNRRAVNFLVPWLHRAVVRAGLRNAQVGGYTV